MEDYLNKLNTQQREAVVYCDGPQLVIAGAGSGKTRVLTYKIVHLLHLGYTPSHIMALTFTNKAAGEMRERITALVGEEAKNLWMGTFHSIFAKLLRINADRIGFNHDFTIYDTNDSRSLIKLIVKDMQLDDKLYRPATLQSRFSMMKNALITPSYYEKNKAFLEEDKRANRPLTSEIYKTYCHRCKIAGAMD
ncbi:MAG: UvrD-helicase domain-containing protein, partial [Muribaculaceae bacterium]|nr:UvrD-helicase domain-containing protein [Muribaculaceae bacterium]